MITGAGGQLGCALLAAAPSGFAVTALDRRKLDIAAPEATRVAMSRYNPELILNAAAYTQVDRAETEREEAYAVNADGPQYLAEVANTIGARLIHISTDYVFNGNSEVPYRPDDPTASLNVYGASKLEGEKRVRSLCPERTLILQAGGYTMPMGRIS